MCARERRWRRETERERSARHETTMARAWTAIQLGEKRETGERQREYRVAVTLESVLARVWTYSEVSDAEGPSDECASRWLVPR
jgi:hypothetical protein